MKKSEIKLGKEYAVRIPRGHWKGAGREVVRATVVRPAVDRGRWVIVREGDEPAQDRTSSVASAQVLQPWTDYCINTAHQDALAMDRARALTAAYEAECARLDAHRRPLVDALRGITVPGAALSTANFDQPDRDLGDWLHESFVDGRASGVSVTFDVFEALAREILDLRGALLDAQGGWTDSPLVDTGVPEVDETAAAAANAAAAVAHLEARADTVE